MKSNSRFLLPAILAVLGVAWLADLSPDHSACSSVLVRLSSQAACNGDDVRWVIAWAMVGLAVVILVIQLFTMQKAESKDLSYPNSSRPETMPEGSQQSPVSAETGFCSGCGQPRQPAARFCSSCGHSFDADTSQ